MEPGTGAGELAVLGWGEWWRRWRRTPGGIYYAAFAPRGGEAGTTAGNAAGSNPASSASEARPPAGTAEGGTVGGGTVGCGYYQGPTAKCRCT